MPFIIFLNLFPTKVLLVGQHFNVASVLSRLATWDMRSQLHTPKDRSLSQAFFQLDVLKDKLGLSDSIVEKTAYIYRKAQSNNLTRGRIISGVLAAAVYIACREMGAHRTLDDIATACNVTRKELSKNFRVLHNDICSATSLMYLSLTNSNIFLRIKN